MRILLDQCAPAPLRRELVGHIVETAFEMGWGTLRNGALLDRAEQNGYDLLITTDQSIPYQQSLIGRRISHPPSELVAPYPIANLHHSSLHRGGGTWDRETCHSLSRPYSEAHGLVYSSPYLGCRTSFCIRFAPAAHRYTSPWESMPMPWAVPSSPTGPTASPPQRASNLPSWVTMLQRCPMPET